MDSEATELSNDTIQKTLAVYGVIVAEVRAIADVMSECGDDWWDFCEESIPSITWLAGRDNTDPTVLCITWEVNAGDRDYGSRFESRSIPVSHLFNRDWVEAYRQEAKAKEEREDAAHLEGRIEQLRQQLAAAEARKAAQHG